MSAALVLGGTRSSPGGLEAAPPDGTCPPPSDCYCSSIRVLMFGIAGVP